MVRCPKCKKKIDCLLWEGGKKHTGTLSINEDGNEEFDEDSNIFSQESYSYFCPECDEKIFEDDEDAIEFLKKEEDELKELIEDKIEDG